MSAPVNARADRRENVEILGIPIAAVDMAAAVARIESWIAAGEHAYVTVTGVHGIMESQRDPELRHIHRAAGMCAPDGMPAVWVGRFSGHRRMRRVYGPSLMLEMMRLSAKRGYTHYFYGGREGVARQLSQRFRERFPGLRVVGTYTPPFRPLNDAEEEALRREIDALVPDIIWVGLGTPKQERWMARHSGRLNCRVMIGVGAAFDFHAGNLRQAPRWIQQAGLEWLFRLIVEPRRLWRRYLANNPRFIWLLLRRALGLSSRAGRASLPVYRPGKPARQAGLASRPCRMPGTSGQCEVFGFHGG